MDAITYAAARSDLAGLMDRVCEESAPVIITRNEKPAVVMISRQEYESLRETLYLLGTARNARRLLDSVAELEAGSSTD